MVSVRTYSSVDEQRENERIIKENAPWHRRLDHNFISFPNVFYRKSEPL